MSGVNPALILRIAANIDGLKAALAAGRIDIEQTTAGARKLGASLDGSKLEQRAFNITAAIAGIGGATKLTDTEAQRLLKTLDAWVEKAKRMGTDVPPQVLATRDALKQVGDAADKASTQTSSWSTSLNSLKGVLGALGITLSIGAVVNFTREILRMGDEITRVSDRTGLTTDEVQRFSFAAEQSGNTLEELTGSIGQMQNRLASGDDSALAALKALGVSFNNLRAMGPGQQLQAIAAAVEKIPNPARQAQLAMDLFGRSGVAILPTLKSHFDDLAASAPVMSAATVKALDEAGDALSKFQLTVKVAAAESYNWAGSLFDKLIITVYLTIAKIYDAIASLTAMASKIPGASGLAGSAKGFTESAQWYRDAAAMMAKSNEAIVASAKPVVPALDLIVKGSSKVATEAKKAAVDLLKFRDSVKELGTTTSTFSVFLGDGTTKMTGFGTVLPTVVNGVSRVTTALQGLKANGLLPAYTETVRITKALGIDFVKGVKDAQAAVEAHARASKQYFGEAGDAADEEVGQISEAFGRLSSMFDGINSKFGQAAKIVSGSLSVITREGAKLPEQMAAGFAAAAQMVGEFAGTSVAAQTAMGGLTGATIGMTIATMALKGAWAGPIGAIIGAAIGALVAGFSAAGAEAKRLRLANAEATDSIKELEKSLIKTYGSMDAIREIGAALRVDLAGMWGSEGKKGLADFTQTLDEFEERQKRLFESIKTNSGLASRELLNLIETYEKLGNAVSPELQASMNDFVVSQLVGAAAGLNALLGGMQASATAAARVPAQAMVDAFKAQLAALGPEADAALRQTIENAIANAEQARDAIVGVFVQTDQQARGLGAAIVGTFAEMLARGTSFKDSLAAIQPALTTLQAQLDATGYSGGTAFAGLVTLSNIASDAITGPLVDAIIGANSALQGLNNANILNQESFSALAFTAVDAYNQIIANTGNAGAAMQLMQPTLQTLWQLSNDFNYSLSEEEQQLVSNAQQAGLVGDRFRDAADRMARSLERVVEILELIATNAGLLPDTIKVPDIEGPEFDIRLPVNEWEDDFVELAAAGVDAGTTIAAAFTDTATVIDESAASGTVFGEAIAAGADIAANALLNAAQSGTDLGTDIAAGADDATQALMDLEMQMDLEQQTAEAERAATEAMDAVELGADDAKLAVENLETQFVDLVLPAENARDAGVDAGARVELAADDARLAVEEWDGSFVDLQDRMDAIDTAPIYALKRAVDETIGSVNKLNFGSSPGGLNEIPLLLDEAEAHARSFQRTMQVTTGTVYGDVNAMTGEMEALVKQLGLMYAFAAGDFGDFLVGDEKRLKENGLYDFWRTLREQMTGATDDASAFARVMTDATDAAVEGLSEMTGEMEEAIEKLGLMYAFASGDFGDFAAGDEKRLKEAGLYEFWKDWRSQFIEQNGGGDGGDDGPPRVDGFGAGGGTGGWSGGDSGRIAGGQGWMGIPPKGSGETSQTIIVQLDGSTIARAVVKNSPTTVRLYTR